MARSKELVDLVKKAFNLQQLGLKFDALNSYKQALELAPNDGEILQLYGTLLLQLRDPGSVQVLERASELLPNEPFVKYNLGIAYRDNKRPTDAKPYIQNWLASTPGDTTAWLVLSMCGCDLGDKQLAFTSIRQALALGRRDHLCLEHWAHCYRTFGPIEPAIYIYKSILGKYPKSRGTRVNLALLQLEAGDFTEGWANYEARFLVNPKQSHKDFIIPIDEELLPSDFTGQAHQDPCRQALLGQFANP